MSRRTGDLVHCGNHKQAITSTAFQDITHPTKADLPPPPPNPHLVGLPVKLEFGILFLLIHGPLYKHKFLILQYLHDIEMGVMTPF